jgi:hypothetical protein
MSKPSPRQDALRAAREKQHEAEERRVALERKKAAPSKKPERPKKIAVDESES